MLEEDLTTGERLFLHRFREQKSAATVANEFGVGLRQYRRWEEDVEPYPGDVDLGGILPNEHYRIMRRRSGLSREEIGKRIGLSHTVIALAERGRRDLKPLIEFWGS